MCLEARLRSDLRHGRESRRVDRRREGRLRRRLLFARHARGLRSEDREPRPRLRGLFSRRALLQKRRVEASGSSLAPVHQIHLSEAEPSTFLTACRYRSETLRACPARFVEPSFREVPISVPGVLTRSTRSALRAPRFVEPSFREVPISVPRS